MELEFWILTPLLFVSGDPLGRWHNRRWRYDRVAAAKRVLQLKVLSLELKSLRNKVVSAQGRRTPSAKRRHGRTPWLSGFIAHWMMHCCAMCSRSTTGT